jgi:ankyrin repeat protein
MARVPRAKKLNVPKKLVRAAKDGDLPVVKRYLETHDANATWDRSGRPESLLGWAVDMGETEVVRLLLEAGADPNAGPTAHLLLKRAGYTGSVETVRLLLRAGLRFERGDTAAEDTDLGFACIYEHPAVVRVLLKAGVDPNGFSAQGRTALMELADMHGDDPGRLACARVLLAGGADPRLRRKGGPSAIDVARDNGYRKLLALLSAPRP